MMALLGLILFFSSGILLSYLIYPKTGLIKRAVFSVSLTTPSLLILAFPFYLFNLLNRTNAFLILILFNLVLFLILRIKKEELKTNFEKDIVYLLIFTFLGTIWRIIFLKSIEFFGEAYQYAGKFSSGQVPNLGFYTGLAKDYSGFPGRRIFFQVSELIFIDRFLDTFRTFLITFVFVGFIYLIFSAYRNRNFALLGAALMSLGPVEIFHSTLNFFGHSFSYPALFSLFLLFKEKGNKIFWAVLIFSLAMMLTYYTSLVVLMLASLGFIVAVFIKEKRILINKKILAFLTISIILSGYLFLISNMNTFTIGSAQTIPIQSEKKVKEFFGEIFFDAETYELDLSMENLTYENPTFLRLSAIRWQILFFIILGLTFIVHLARKRDFSEQNKDLLLCFIPVLIISYGFYHAGFLTRIFDYFAFFGILVLRIPKRYFKIFAVLFFAFLLITGIFVARDKKIFFENSEGEVLGAQEIGRNFQGIIFSDQKFINLLVLNNYYEVTGADDESYIVKCLFYQNNEALFLSKVKKLKNLGVKYIAITKRMEEKYVLMLNYEQKPMRSIELYKKNLKKVYDNGDVKLYEVKE